MQAIAQDFGAPETPAPKLLERTYSHVRVRYPKREGFDVILLEGSGIGTRGIWKGDDTYVFYAPPVQQPSTLVVTFQGQVCHSVPLPPLTEDPWKMPQGALHPLAQIGKWVGSTRTLALPYSCMSLDFARRVLCGGLYILPCSVRTPPSLVASVKQAAACAGTISFPQLLQHMAASSSSAVDASSDLIKFLSSNSRPGGGSRGGYDAVAPFDPSPLTSLHQSLKGLELSFGKDPIAIAPNPAKRFVILLGRKGPAAVPSSTDREAPSEPFQAEAEGVGWLEEWEAFVRGSTEVLSLRGEVSPCKLMPRAQRDGEQPIGGGEGEVESGVDGTSTRARGADGGVWGGGQMMKRLRSAEKAFSAMWDGTVGRVHSRLSEAWSSRGLEESEGAPPPLPPAPPLISLSVNAHISGSIAAAAAYHTITHGSTWIDAFTVALHEAFAVRTTTDAPPLVGWSHKKDPAAPVAKRGMFVGPAWTLATMGPQKTVAMLRLSAKKAGGPRDSTPEELEEVRLALGADCLSEASGASGGFIGHAGSAAASDQRELVCYCFEIWVGDTLAAVVLSYRVGRMLADATAAMLLPAGGSAVAAEDAIKCAIGRMVSSFRTQMFPQEGAGSGASRGRGGAVGAPASDGGATNDDDGSEGGSESSGSWADASDEEDDDDDDDHMGLGQLAPAQIATLLRAAQSEAKRPVPEPPSEAEMAAQREACDAAWEQVDGLLASDASLSGVVAARRVLENIHLSPGKILTHCIGSAAVAFGCAAWYWGSVLPYMKDYTSMGGREVDNEWFIENVWDVESRTSLPSRDIASCTPSPTQGPGGAVNDNPSVKNVNENEEMVGDNDPIIRFLRSGRGLIPPHPRWVQGLSPVQA